MIISFGEAGFEAAVLAGVLLRGIGHPLPPAGSLLPSPAPPSLGSKTSRRQMGGGPHKLCAVGLFHCCIELAY